MSTDNALDALTARMLEAVKNTRESADSAAASAQQAQKMAEGGDAQAKLVLEAMPYQVAKDIGAMAAVLEGQVDAIALTGGIAYAEAIVADIRRRVEFIAPVYVVPGEEELESLALGALRVLRGKEEAWRYE